MKSVKRIITILGGIESFDSVELAGDNGPLQVERDGTGPNGRPLLRVRQTGRAALEMAFEWVPELPELSPISFTDRDRGISQESVYSLDGETIIRIGLKRHHDSLAASWGRSIQEQGYVQAARVMASRRKPFRLAA